MYNDVVPMLWLSSSKVQQVTPRESMRAQVLLHSWPLLSCSAQALAAEEEADQTRIQVQASIPADDPAEPLAADPTSPHSQVTDRCSSLLRVTYGGCRIWQSMK